MIFSEFRQFCDSVLRLKSISHDQNIYYLRRCFIIIVTSLISFHLSSQRGIAVDGGAVSASLGGINTVIQGSDAVFNNFAQGTDVSKLSILLSTSRRFSLVELQSVSLGLSTPISGFGHFGLTFSRYGFDLYSESAVNLHYARKLKNNLAISAMIGANSFQIQENGNTVKVGYKLGAAGSISKDLSYGLTLSNLERISVEENAVLLSQVAFGLRYEVSHKAIVFGEVEKELEEDLTFKAGVSYHLHSSFSLMLGYNTNPGQTSIGFSLRILPALELQSSFMYHSLLGLTPVVTLKYRGSQNDDLKR